MYNYFFFFIVPSGTQDLRSQTKEQTHAPRIGSVEC